MEAISKQNHSGVGCILERFLSQKKKPKKTQTTQESRTSEPFGVGVPATSATFFPTWLTTSHSAALKTLLLFVLLMRMKNRLGLLKEAG